MGVFTPPSYSPDLASIEYNLFRASNNFFSGKIFDDLDDEKTPTHDNFISKPQNFHLRGIHLLPNDVTDSNGKYA